MAAETNGHGGVRKGQGRPPKSDEIALIEKLKPLDELAFKLIKNGLALGDAAVLKLFMGYRFGQPKQSIDANLTGELNINWFEEKTYENQE